MAGTAVGSRTASLVERAERLFPGGVNSPVRALQAVGRRALVPMAAGIATLAELTPDRYVALEETAANLARGLADAAAAAQCPVAVARVGPLLTVFFRPTVASDAAEALASDRAAYARFFGSMLDQGVFLPPSQFEAWFPSMTHDPADVAETVLAARVAFEESAA